ncbi:MAG: VOC family protein [Ignavibacteriales bacterium]|nr:VOC family protein [Ignavibacteriales bacterium]
MIDVSYTILYVKDQQASAKFYSNVLSKEPRLNVPGMTEFDMAEKSVLGLMPEVGIKRLLGEKLPDPSQANGIPRAEIYLMVDKPQEYFERAIKNGASELSKLEKRNWGHHAAYCLDPDGHVLAFAKE